MRPPSRWQAYFHKLLHEKGQRDIVLGDLTHFDSLREFWFCILLRNEVRNAINRMSRERTIGPNVILEEFWKSTNKASMKWLTRLF